MLVRLAGLEARGSNSPVAAWAPGARTPARASTSSAALAASRLRTVDGEMAPARIECVVRKAGSSFSRHRVDELLDRRFSRRSTPAGRFDRVRPVSTAPPRSGSFVSAAGRAGFNPADPHGPGDAVHRGPYIVKRKDHASTRPFSSSLAGAIERRATGWQRRRGPTPSRSRGSAVWIEPCPGEEAGGPLELKPSFRRGEEPKTVERWEF